MTTKGLSSSLSFTKPHNLNNGGYLSLTCWYFYVAVPRGPRCVQAAVTGGDPKDKEREEAETEREKAEGDRKPQASGQCQSGPEKPGVCGGTLAATR